MHEKCVSIKTPRVKARLSTCLVAFTWVITSLFGLSGKAYAENPSMPMGLSLAVYSPTAAELFWQASTDADGIAFYRVYISGSLYREAPGPSIYFESLFPGKRYDVQISAIDRKGNESPWSPVFRVQTPGGSSAGSSGSSTSAGQTAADSNVAPVVPVTPAATDVTSEVATVVDNDNQDSPVAAAVDSGRAR